MKEWTEQFGGKKEGETKGPGFKPLPFDCCAISLTAFEDPYCTEDGNVYDLVNIVPYLKKYKKDPISGKPLASKDLIQLHFHKNTHNEYHCPITFKVFNDFTHIVAIKTSGEVYCMEAIEELNIKAKNWTDLLTQVPFTRKDIISIQDPQHLEKRNWANFLHIREKIEKGEIEDPDGGDETSRTINLNSTTARVIKEMAEKEVKDKEQKKEKEDRERKKEEKKTAAPAVKSEQAVQAPSFTSSSFTAASLIPAHPADAPGKVTKKKGYAKIRTNLGVINVELHCDLVPKACENFIGLCEAGYYNNVIFHRSIKNFMIQGGDPTGTGKGGESIWKRSFKDEFRTTLVHEGRGILAMANSGPGSNNSQFFITYKSAPWLNNKHTVFGRVVGGIETLRIMEAVPVDDTDRPIHEIKILGTDVFVNPFAQLDEEKAEEIRKEEEEKRKKDDRYVEEGRGNWYSNPAPAPLKTTKTGIGKYLPSNLAPTPGTVQKRKAEGGAQPPAKKTA